MGKKRQAKRTKVVLSGTSPEIRQTIESFTRTIREQTGHLVEKVEAEKTEAVDQILQEADQAARESRQAVEMVELIDQEINKLVEDRNTHQAIANEKSHLEAELRLRAEQTTAGFDVQKMVIEAEMTHVTDALGQ